MKTSDQLIQPRQTALLLACMAALLAPCETSGARLLVLAPAELTRLSDLVVVGRLGTNGVFRVEEILKGETKERDLSVPGVVRFSNEGFYFPLGLKIELSDEAILFLSQRTCSPSVVANGVYRMAKVDSKPGVVGYSQQINPGGYVLERHIQFKDLLAVKALVKKEIDAIPAQQQAAIEKVKTAETSADVGQALHELQGITRFGDLDVLKQIATLDVDGTTRLLRHIVYFIENVKGPRGASLLQGLFDKYHDVSILEPLGRLGNPESVAYFEAVIEKKQVAEPVAALRGLQQLYLALEARGDAKSCAIVRDCMYHYVDKDLMVLMEYNPWLISVIPEQSALDRLNRACEYYVQRKKNEECHIQKSIETWKEKVRLRGKNVPNK